MPLDFTTRGFDPQDPDGPLRHLSRSDATRTPMDEDAPWVEPDYTTVAREADLVGGGPFRDWPGPPMIMPAGLLPDGRPWGNSDMDNAERIEGVRPRNPAEAEGCVIAYNRQQRLLREEAGIDPAFRVRGVLKDTPAAYEAIVQLHLAERERRARQRRAS
ncbi:hypothetical protein ACFXGA_18595 [Actinosynnema sp. NPDC059335]|uniref:hypothetical protein n=1 Tax=Actinosynnema sp. NPDC059335 TaxID=3346804 RepID=UPI00366F749A